MVRWKLQRTECVETHTQNTLTVNTGINHNSKLYILHLLCRIYLWDYFHVSSHQQLMTFSCYYDKNNLLRYSRQYTFQDTVYVTWLKTFHMVVNSNPSIKFKCPTHPPPPQRRVLRVGECWLMAEGKKERDKNSSKPKTRHNGGGGDSWGMRRSRASDVTPT